MSAYRKIVLIAFISLVATTQALAYQQIEFVREIGEAGNKAKQRIMNAPRALAMTTDRIYLADTDAHRIVVLDQSGKTVLSWGTKGNKPGQLKSPAGIAVDDQGMVFIADTGNHRIQVFDHEGKFVRSFGAKGSGPREFSAPSGIAVSKGIVYVADAGNSRIQVLTPEGIFISEITVKAENDQMKEPVGVAIDLQNRIYAIDAGTNAVRVFSPTGIQESKFGCSGSGNEGFDKPQSIAVDRYGNIYVADTGNYKFKKFDQRGRFLGSAGSRGDGPGQFREPSGIIVDRENRVSVLDAEKNTLQTFSSETGEDKPLAPASPRASVGLLREYAGEFNALAINDKQVWAVTRNNVTELGAASPKQFSSLGGKPGLLKNARGIAIDANNGFWVADTGNDRLQKFNPDGSFAQTVGQGGSREGEFDSPSGIAISPLGKIFVADAGNKRVQVFSAKGVFLVAIGKGGKLAGQMQEPVDLAVDKTENVYIVDRANERIAKYDNSGKLVWETGKSGKQDGEFKAPENILVTADNEVYVLDAGNSRIQVFDTNGKFLRTFGCEGKEAGEFQAPLGMAMENGIRLYVGDKGNTRVQVFTLRHTPATPKDATALERPNEIQVSWKANTETYHDQYEVYRLDPATGDFILAGSTKDPFYLDRALPSGKTYTYRVSSRAREGNESGPTAPIVATTPKLVPAEPRAVSIEAREKQVTLSWRPNNEPYMDHYNIYRRKQAAATFELIAKSAKNVYIDRPLDDETEYTYKIAAVGKEDDESPSCGEVSAMTPKPSLTVPPLEVVKIDLGAIYASAYKYYESHPLGKITIKNNTDKDLEQVKLSFSIKNFMDFPTDLVIPKIASKQEVELELKPVLNNRILEVTENTPLQSEIALVYFIENESKTLSRSFPLTLYERHAMVWDDKAKLGAFVTSKDPAVADFTRLVIQQYVDAYPTLPQSIVYADAVYSALGVLGTAYIIDPSSPFQSFSENVSNVDYLQYPRDTLARKSGDCDDLSILFAAALENIGIGTAFVDVPGHVFLMFNTGVLEKEKETLGFPDDLLVAYQDTMWVPVEMTMVGASFTKAWEKGAAEYREWSAKGKADIINTQKAWDRFKPVTLPPGDAKTIKVKRDDIEAKYPDELDTMAQKRLTHLTAELRQTLKKKPNDLAALTQLGILYGEYGLHAEALEQFEKMLEKSEGNPVALNNIGNIRFLQGKYEEALQAYEAALKTNADDPGIMVNLARTLQKLKKTDAAKKRLQDAAMLDPRVVRQYSDIASSLGVK